LPGIPLPPTLVPTSDLGEALARTTAILCVVPSHHVRNVMSEAASRIDGAPIIISASKGIEDESSRTMLGVLEDVLPARLKGRIAALSGPSFAREVARGMPTAVTAASVSAATATQVQSTFTTSFFRVYTSTDVIGVELGGAVKNVIAIGAGLADGLGFGHNTRAALITRGIAELQRLGARMGADPRTLAGLSGLGDLVLTCTGDLSRNRTVGLRLGRGEKLEDIVGDMKMVAEGIRNAKSVHQLAAKVGVDMPITEQMYLLLHEGKPPRQVVIDLMGRELKPEFY
ncbi:MAG: glycerol-3-phosphate dehydrogenase, partial [Candidatus Binatota bacterium]|nr:glycerol-3-phosphate dehydrogenase [Candidatus Binatota bacterium]